MCIPLCLIINKFSFYTVRVKSSPVGAIKKTGKQRRRLAHQNVLALGTTPPFRRAFEATNMAAEQVRATTIKTTTGRRKMMAKRVMTTGRPDDDDDRDGAGRRRREE
jgi:hypothetical protein